MLLTAAWLVIAIPGAADAATYYIGSFSGSRPADDARCGTGKGAGAAGHPCATLEHFNRERRSSVRDGDTVRLAPGLYRPAKDTAAHCIAAQRGVTYEGRDVDDVAAAPAEAVVIDMARTTVVGPCFGRGVSCASSRGCDASGFTLRDVTLRNGRRQGVKLDVPTGVIVDGFTLERVHIAGFGEQGINLSNQPSDIDCRTTGRRVRNVVIRDSLVEDNHGVFGGIALNCIDGFTVEGTTVRENLPAGCTWEQCRSHACDCDDHDGLQLVGAINGVFRGGTIERCGEDCLDIGGHWRKTYNITVEGNRIRDGGSRWMKMSGGTHDIAVRNNYFTGSGVFEMATCQTNVDVSNNTMWRDDVGEVVKIWTKCQTCEFVNNIVVGRTGGASDRIIMVSRAGSDPSVRWMANVVYNAGDGGLALREETGRGNCGNCTCGGDCLAPAWCPEPWPSPQRNQRLRIDELARFQREGDAGDWFGAESGDRDVWGERPATVRGEADTVSLPRLAVDDLVAQDRGLDLSRAGRCTAGRCTKGSPGTSCSTHAECAFTRDFDGELRTGPWDIGADEQPASGPFPPASGLEPAAGIQH